MSQVRAILATTHEIDSVYGRVRLSEDELTQMLAAIRSGSVPMTFNHDAQQPLAATVMACGIEETGDGHQRLWCEFEVPDSEWDYVQEQIRSNNAPGGFSFTTGHVIKESEEPPLIELAADEYHFSRDNVVAAADAMSVSIPTEASHIRQFSVVPEAVVVLTFAYSVLQGVPVNLLSQLVFDSLKGLFKRSGKNTFNLRVKQQNGRVDTKVSIVTEDAESLRGAIESLADSIRATQPPDSNDTQH